MRVNNESEACSLGSDVCDGHLQRLRHVTDVREDDETGKNTSESVSNGNYHCISTKRKVLSWLRRRHSIERELEGKLADYCVRMTSPECVVLEIVIRGESNETSPTHRHAEKYLDSCVAPDLQKYKEY